MRTDPEDEPTNTFHISFNTKRLPGFIQTVKVTIENDVMDNMDEVRVDLAAHPLYRELEEYVLANPTGKGRL